jgi:SAM-dependent methyltransferase
MHPRWWIPADAASLLDVGCNVGALLRDSLGVNPGLRLAGIDVNAAALAKARRLVPEAELHCGGAEALPFADTCFDCVTCIEVLEHIPGQLRRPALREMHRVLRPGGRLVLRVPHAGSFAWLDAGNFRFRFPRLYRLLLGTGRRDAGYAGRAEGVVWHHHFTRAELLDLAGAGWQVEATRYGGLVLFPLADLLSWPFYRAGNPEHRLRRVLERLADADYGCSYGPASYGILLALRRA